MDQPDADAEADQHQPPDAVTNAIPDSLWAWLFFVVMVAAVAAAYLTGPAR